MNNVRTSIKLGSPLLVVVVLSLSACFGSPQDAPSQQDSPDKPDPQPLLEERSAEQLLEELDTWNGEEEPLFDFDEGPNFWDEGPYDLEEQFTSQDYFGGPTFETVTVLDPVANAFTVEMPLGWDSTVFSSGTFSDSRQTMLSVSPSGDTMLFVGDPSAPAYWSPSDPANQNDMTISLVEQMETSEWSEFQHATQWTENWVYEKFGNLNGFYLFGTEDLPDDAAEASYLLEQALGYSIMATAARTFFQYDTDLGPMNALVHGTTFGTSQAWNIQVRGVATFGDPVEYDQMTENIARSLKFTDEWEQQKDQYWGSIQANHNANMDWIQQSSAAHQAKMESIWAANDASMGNYYDRMSSMDSSQRSFLNYIQEENTVQTSSGDLFQVAQGADNYYVNPSTGEAVAGNSAFGEQDLFDMGLNPSDWEQAEIVP